MARLTINVNQHLGQVGDEFLDERDFEIEFDFGRSSDYVVCIIDGKPDCYIKRSDLLIVLTVFQQARPGEANDTT